MNSTQNGQSEARFRSSMRRGAFAAAAMTAALATTGCAMPSEASSDEGVASVTGAISGANWRPWGDLFTRSYALDTEPGTCGKGLTFSMAVRNPNKNYEISTAFNHLGSTWNTFGSQQFWSAPSCAFTNPSQSDPVLAFYLAGKGTDNHIFVTLATSGDIHYDSQNVPYISPPTQTYQGAPVPWSQLGSNTYVGGTNGFPALASNGSRIVLTTHDGNTIYAFNRTLPYSAMSPWSARVAAPSLPFTAGEGTPAITFVGGSTQAFLVLVKNNAGGLWWILNNGTNFTGVWHPVNLMGHAVNSDPTMEWGDSDGLLTIYYTDTTGKVIQTSAPTPSTLGSQVFDYIPCATGCGFFGSPRALPASIEHGTRSVVIRGFDPDTPANMHNNNVLYSEDFQ
ncbi:MAG: hypothetical protein WDO69_11145 [Pseudomonadota bacterium]